MSRWATVVPRDRTLEVHVVPIDDHDKIANGHVCTLACWCRPVLDELAYARGGLLISHNDPERGGYNA